MKKSRKKMSAPRKPEEKKVKNRFLVSLNDADNRDLLAYMDEESLEERTVAARRLIRWALQQRKRLRDGLNPPKS